MLSAIPAPFRCVLVSLACIVVSCGSAVAQPPLETPPVTRGPIRPVLRSAAGKPPTLDWLAASFEVLQTADVITTAMALRNGLHEQNPLLKGIAGQTLALSAVKASVTTAALVLTHRIVKRHRFAGTLLLAGLDGTLAIIVTRNLQAARAR